MSAAFARLPVPLVAFTGGKGGVGKTTLTANVGVALARARKRVLAVDADFGLANLDVVLGLRPQRTVEAFFESGAELGDCVARGPGGLAVLAGASGSATLAHSDRRRRTRFFGALAELASSYELVLADCPAGIGPDVLSTCARADHVLAVTTPDPAAATDAYGVVKALDSWSTERAVDVPTPEVVVNLVTSAAEAERVAGGVRGVCERFLARSPLLGGWVPRCASALRAAQRREPIVTSAPKSLAGRCLSSLARRVAGRAEALAEAFPS